MEKTDVLIIGGGPAGIIAAVTGKSSYPEKDFVLIRKEKQVIVPCGIPYIFGSLGSSDNDTVSDSVLTGKGVKLIIDEAVSVDREKKVCKTAGGIEIGFEKLVIATGSVPKVPEWLKIDEIENAFTVFKSKEYLDGLLGLLRLFKKVVVVGGGFIGVEMSDEIAKGGTEVTLVEILPHVLGGAFDDEVAVKAEEILKSRGIRLRTGAGIKEILGGEKVSGVLLSDGEKLAADAVILSMGYRPNTDLAGEAGFKINEMGFIAVDEYMRTDTHGIFAVGDCAEKRDFITRKASGVMLASTATSEARVAGMNLYMLSAVKTFSGTISIFSTAIGETGFGVAGLTEKAAREEGFDIVTGSFEGVDKHPKTLEGVHKQFVKLIVARESGVILGGEAAGGLSVGELINVIGLAIQNRMTVNSLLTAQIGTHPLLTAPPTAYPLIKAAEDAAKKIAEAR
jgi:NADH oxidase (H2O2-forming)